MQTRLRLAPWGIPHSLSRPLLQLYRSNKLQCSSLGTWRPLSSGLLPQPAPVAFNSEPWCAKLHIETLSCQCAGGQVQGIEGWQHLCCSGPGLSEAGYQGANILLRFQPCDEHQRSRSTAKRYRILLLALRHTYRPCRHQRQRNRELPSLTLPCLSRLEGQPHTVCWNCLR